jgi:formamidopyrimidine-DNA glycosylase
VPELPEVETVCRGLNQVTLGDRIQGGEVLLERTIAFPESQGFLAALQGCCLVQWERRGKYLLAQLAPAAQPAQSAGYLGVHLRMTGQLLWVDATQAVEKHTRVRFFFGNDHELRFLDQRTFGQLWWVPPDRQPADIITGLGRLGPEPFSEQFSLEYFSRQLHHRHRPIKNALLDQALVAGVGNIYADEALFLSGIHPQIHGADLTLAQRQRLRESVIQVLSDSITAKGTTFRTFRTVEGINGNYGGQAWVYDRDGQPCKVCGTPIERMKLAGRSAHFCPQCQPRS